MYHTNMLILLFRHGPAGDPAAWAKTRKDDALRPLTSDGRKKTRDAAKGLYKVLDGLDLIVSSPLKRAQQTTTLLAARFPKARRAMSKGLAPSADPVDAARWLAAQEAEAVAVVGHEPHLSRLGSFLLTGRPEPVFELKKAGAALLELGERNTLSALYTPKALRRLGR